MKKTAKKTTFTLLALGLASALAVIAVAATDGYTAVSGKLSRKLPIYSVETQEKKIALTFDAAWGVEYTDEILDILKAENVPATFFLVQFWAEKYPEYVKKIDQDGHAVGTHSAVHGHMSKMSAAVIEKDLKASAQAISSITGKPVTLFRPPYGEYNDLVIGEAEKAGLYSVQWDVDTLDWKNLTAKEMEERVLTKAQNGSIVLCHNNGLHTAEFLPGVIKKLKEKGFTFVRVDDLIYKENYEIDVTGRQRFVG